MSAIGKFVAVSTAFIAAPMAPVFVSIPYEFMFSRNIDHLNPMVFICTIFGYLVMLVVALPMHLCAGKNVPQFNTLLVLGGSIGALLPMIIIVPPVLIMSVDDAWFTDLLDALGLLLSGIFFGASSGAVFWILAYSWRFDDSAKANK